MAAWTLRARWVFPVSGPPISDGIVTIDGERIAAVELADACAVDVDLGNAAILPGLVNAHTHLDLTGMRGLAPPSPDFTGWLRQVIAHRRTRTPEQVQVDIHAGIAECLRFGTTLVGDIASGGTSWDALAAALVRAVVFYEVLGLTEERASLAETAARKWVLSHPATPICRPGVSPHAPYSVRKSLFVAAARMAHDRNIALAVHLAESLDEMELLHHRRGPFVKFLADAGVWDRDGLLDDVQGVMGAVNQWETQRLFIHCNHLAPSARIPRGSAVIYCPRTHAAFGHPPHPFREFLARGVRVALGTDSLASNPDLDILAEARFVHRLYPDFSGETLLRMVTLSGAEALGWADETGSLTPEKSADLVVLPLPDADAADPHRLLFDSALAVRAVLFRGRWVHDASGQLVERYER